ncbi:MAG: helix-hairpin-helix domain-containing protein [Bacteroidales bacterium]|nr:helix-hairpin-helix domain-containing protein [Bacteroidales bacterium]
MEEGKKGRERERSGLSASLASGAIALVFLIIGYEVALFLHRAALTRLEANRDSPDTVYVVDPDIARKVFGEASADDGVPSETPDAAAEGKRPFAVRRKSQHSVQAKSFLDKVSPRKVESFRFNPNTVSVEDLQRLGFSEKQAASIDHYRQKGGRFRRKADFAKSYVVSDSVYKRLEPYIDIPRLDINKADSAAFTTLPGIGKFFAVKMVEHREELHGYSSVEQLLDIWHFDEEKLSGIRDLIKCSAPEPYPLWSLPEAELRKHPYIKESAHGIVLYRDNQPRELWSLEGLHRAGVISDGQFRQLSLCRIGGG